MRSMLNVSVNTPNVPRDVHFVTGLYLVTETNGFLLCEYYLISLALHVHFSLECNTCVFIEVIFMDFSECHCL
jgi:hypothetical protein